MLPTYQENPGAHTSGDRDRDRGHDRGHVHIHGHGHNWSDIHNMVDTNYGDTNPTSLEYDIHHTTLVHMGHSTSLEHRDQNTSQMDKDKHKVVEGMILPLEGVEDTALQVEQIGYE
ncbi:hypothetical protein KDA_61190 [Dictyobacter alpinus]|uniref:Uncharacterized protein n=1 Tax=Dictyobacter alpinus TaxID=2014873 RepID=A0A402BGY3_9CHLR|nr:hypothetical protein [Dictyobacter alpinus]GCE30635.1 hypothetical protein KDA_61190 [Dictyobacter alpinus]